MNKIFKVIYSKTRHCYVVVSELAKSHCKTTQSHTVRSKTALTAAVLLALGAFSFVGMPSVQADGAGASDYNNDFMTANDTYWYWNARDKKWETKAYTSTNLFHNRARGDLPNYKGKGAKEPGAITGGLYAQAGRQTVTIGNRNAGQSKGSVFIGELSGYYDNPDGDLTAGVGNNYVTSVGFQSNATGWGSIAIGSNATAVNSDKNGGLKYINDDTDNGTNELVANPEIKGASVAIGYGASAADGALAMGSKATATNFGTALGYGASAADSNIAIGANSVATAAASKETAKFRDKKDSDYNAPSSYVSVGSSMLKRRITNVAAGSDPNDVATVGQLSYVEKEVQAKGSWKLTAGGTNESTVEAGSTVNFSAGSDGNLSVTKMADSNNVTIGLNKDVTLGKAAQGEGGSLSVYQDPSSADQENGKDQLGSHVRIDGSTVSIRYPNGTKDSDARGVVLGVAKDSSNPLGYMYLADGDNHYYVHGTMANDPKALQGRLVYNSSLTGYNYIANLEDGISFSGDAVKAGSTTTNTTADTRLDPTAANHTLSITGGVTDTTKLTSDNIGVVTTPTEYDSTLNNGVTEAGGLTIQLAKDLKGITSIANGADGSGANITLDTKGTTISGGDVNVSNNKITGLKNGAADTDAATVGQMKTAIGNAKTKYYSVTNSFKLGDYRTNENNDGATDDALAGMAAGYETGTTGIASTVAGSYSGVIGSGLQGAAAVSVGTVNVNNNTGTSKAFSGVANSIVGQANMTTDSNAAIIVGAGNSVTNSYRDLDTTTDTLSNIKRAVASKDANALKKALQDAVPKSGAQVMVMGGGNSVDKAYMTQVVGVGNKVTGHDTTYAEGTSTQYNYVDGFQNTLTNGKNDYIIGANNSVTGDSIDKNQSNIVVGDNHTLNNEKNNVVLGSADSSKELAASGAVVIGHNADVSVDNGVALGSGSVASTDKDVEGYDPLKKGASESADKAWKSSWAAVSVGDGTHTRQITGVAAGTNDTDAVNVAQIKKLANIDASNIGKNYKDGDATANEIAWGKAIGTGKVADPTQSPTNDPTQNGSQQLVTGGEVYNALHGGLMDITVGKAGKDGIDGKDGSIGLNGKNGKDGITTTIIKTEKGQPGKDGAPGVDGKDITRIVYQNDTNGDGKHTVATLDDGLKFGDDFGKTAKVKLDQQLDVVGDINAGKTDGDKKATKDDLSDGNIGVVATDTVYNDDGTVNTNGKMTIKLAKDLKNLNSSTYTTETTGEGDQQKTTTYTTVINGKGLTIQSGEQGSTTPTSGPSITIDGINAGGKAITNLKDGVLSDSSTDAVTGKQLYAEQKARTDADTKLTSDLSAETQAREAADTAINNKLGTLDANGNYIQKDASVSSNLNTLDTQVKANADAVSKEKQDREAAITNITNNIGDLSDSAVQYDKDSNKGTVTLAGADGTTIKNLKAGEVAETSKDAVNGSQLYTEQKARTDADTKLTNDLSAETQAREAADTAINNKLGTLDANGNYIQKDASVSSNLNTLDTQVKANADAVSKEKQDREAAITNITNNIGDLSDSAVQYDKDSNKGTVTLAGADGTTIKNLKAGEVAEASKDAVNGSQLYAEQKARTDADTKLTSDLSAETQAREAADTAINDKLGTLDANGNYIQKDASVSSNLNTLDTQVKANADAVSKEKQDREAAITNITNNMNSLTDSAVQYDKDSNKGTVTLAGADGTIIKNLKAGEVAEASKDAVNGSQLYAEQKARIAAVTDLTNKVGSLDSGLKTTSDLIHTNTTGDTIQIGGNSTATKIDVNGKDGKGRVITGVVSDANDPNSAANVGYVNDVTAASTQQVYRDMNRAYGSLNNNINRAAAGSNALAALHPLDFDPADKASFAFGYGHYRNANAGAFGAFYQPNANTMVNFGITVGNGDPGFNAGVSFKIGKGSAYNGVSKAEMAQTIHDQATEISAIKADDAAKDKRIDALEKENQEMKKQIQEILARLNG